MVGTLPSPDTIRGPDVPVAGQRPYQAQGIILDAIHSRDPELIVGGPAGTGKSRGGLEKVYMVCSKYPRARALMVRKTRRSLTQSAMVTFKNKVIPAGSPVYYHGGDHEFRWPNGSVCVLTGMDNPGKALSTDYDFIYVMQAEELDVEDWETLTTRRRNWVVPYQQLWGDCNPAGPKHWILQRAAAGRLTLYPSTHEDNPQLYNARTGEWTQRGLDYLATLDSLTGVRLERLRWGKWVAAEGVVYHDFDRRVHWVKRFNIPFNWRRWRAIDFGYNHPFVCQWWTESPDGDLYLYRELYGVHRLVEDWAKLIKSWSGGEHYAGTITDHDAEGRATLERHLGITTIPARKSVLQGIEAVQGRLRKGPSGRPRLMIFQDALIFRDEVLDLHKQPASTVEEFEMYVWEKDKEGRPDKETPVKAYDHGLDAMRYMVMHLDRPTAESARTASERYRRAFN